MLRLGLYEMKSSYYQKSFAFHVCNPFIHILVCVWIGYFMLGFVFQLSFGLTILLGFKVVFNLCGI